MSKFSYKTLLIIFLSLLIAIVILWKFVLPKQQIKASWWDDNWHYRQAINISSHTSSESNVYIITNISIGSTNIIQTDAGDFRFISQSGENLSYYIVSGVGTTNLTFHILIPSFSSGAQTIYSYYGNTTATNGFSSSDFTTQATNYTIGSISPEEAGGGPIAYWKFDEGVGITAYDSSGNNNSVLSGNTLPTWQTEDQCISGKCLSFKGLTTTSNSQLTNNLNNNISNDKNFTMSAWINLKGAPYLYSGTIISAGNWNTANGYWTFGIHYAGGIYDGPQLGYGTGRDIAYTFNLNQWYFVTWVNNSGTNYFYLNGKYINSSTEANYSSITIPQIGQANYGPYFSFNGLIDDLKIYPYARTPDQIKQDYNSRGTLSGSSANLGVQSSTAPSLKSSLIAHYKFDEGTGTTIFDSSSQQKNASLVGSTLPSWTIGKYNKALDFNANTQRVLIGTTTPINNQATATLWYKRTNTASTSWRTILGDKTANIHHLIIHNTTRNIGIFDGTWRDFGYNPPDDNQFHYYAVVYDIGTSASLYVDGLYKNKIYTTLNLTNNPIGSIGNWSGFGYWAGIIDEVKIYNTALTDEEIKQDYNSGSATQFGSTTQNIGGTTTSLDYCIPGDTSFCASPVAEWNFEENTGTTVKDNSGNNNNGTFGVGNSSPIWTIGKKNTGAGLKFDGVNDFVNINNNTSLNPGTGNFTISMWLKVNSGATNYGIVTKDFTTGYGVFYTPANNSIGLYVQSGTNANNISIVNNYSKWVYVTWTVDNTNDITKSYVNGVFNNQTNYAIGDITNTSPLNIGKYSPGANHFNGETDDIRIYNYIRTPAQIAYDYNKGGPVGWWKLDECQGLTAFDASGLGNTGAIIIGSSGSQTSAGTCNTSSTAWNNGANGKTNSSLNFDGTDDYVTTVSLPTTESFSLSTWFKPGSSITDGQRIYWGNGTNRAILAYSGTSGNLQWYIQTSSSSTGYKISINKFKLNDWNHTVLIYNGSSVKLYINGILDPTTVSINGTSNASGFNFGTNYNRTSNWFNGQIDDIRFYNYALTDEQIKQTYNGGAINFN